MRPTNSSLGRGARGARLIRFRRVRNPAGLATVCLVVIASDIRLALAALEHELSLSVATHDVGVSITTYPPATGLCPGATAGRRPRWALTESRAYDHAIG